MRFLLCALCAAWTTLLAAAELPAAGTVLSAGTRTNASIEFRASDGSRRPAIFTAAGSGAEVLRSTGSGLDGGFALVSTALSLVPYGDRSRHLLGELVSDRETTAKDGSQRMEAVAPEAQVTITGIGPLQAVTDGKKTQLSGKATGTLILAGKNLALSGEVRATPAGKGGAEGLDLHLSFTATGAELGLARDAQVPVAIDVYVRVSPPAPAKPAPAPKPKPKR
jgi:hypothetical protein